MTRGRLLAFVCLIIALGTAAKLRADDIPDPSVDIQDPLCQTSPCPNPVTSDTFMFSPVSGGGILTFTNESGNNWISLTITETGQAAAGITCPVGPQTAFLFCDVTDTTPAGATTPSAQIFYHGIDSFDLNLSADQFACFGDEPPPFGPAETLHCGILQGDEFSINLNDPDSQTGSWPDVEFTAVAGTAVPEPSSCVLLLAGAGEVMRRLRKRAGR